MALSVGLAFAPRLDPAFAGKGKKAPAAKDQPAPKKTPASLPSKQGTGAIPRPPVGIGWAAAPIQAQALRETKPKIDVKLPPHAQALYDLLERFIEDSRKTGEVVLGKLKNKSLSEPEQKQLRKLERAIKEAIKKAEALLEKVKSLKKSLNKVDPDELRECIDQLQQLEALLSELGVPSSELSEKIVPLRQMLIGAEDIGQFAKREFYNALEIYVKAKQIIAKKSKLGERLGKGDIIKIFGLSELSDDAYGIIFHKGKISNMQEFGEVCATIAHNVNAFGTPFEQYCASNNIVPVESISAPIVKAFGKNSSVFVSQQKLNELLDDLNDKNRDLGEMHIKNEGRDRLREILDNALKRVRENSTRSEIEQEIAACTVRAVREYIYTIFKDPNGGDPKAPEHKFNEFISLAKKRPDQFEGLVRKFLTNGGFKKEEFKAALDGKLILKDIPAPVLTDATVRERSNPDIAAVPAAKREVK